MRLELDPLDLKAEYRDGDNQKINTRDVTLDKLTEEAQGAVRAVGRGVFYTWDRRTYCAVFEGMGRARVISGD